MIACKCEAAIERELPADETPDGRPGIGVLFFTMDSDSLGKRLIERIGQTVLTCPTTALFRRPPGSAGPRRRGQTPSATFGDRFQSSKVIGGQRYWRIPVMEGEFLLQETFGMQKKGIGGGNFLILAETRMPRSRRRRRRCGDDGMPGVILPFPGGDRAQRQQGRRASYTTHDRVDQRRVLPDAASDHASALPEGVNSVLEIVLDGLDRRASAAPCASASTPRAVRACARSAPATTAASSARTTSTCAQIMEGA